jgi:hypothetical protein
MLELQAPQGPYTNVLDLQIFPAMSKRHSELLQVFSNTEADKERIWKIALEIWKTITSSMVARAFLLAYRIMGRIIENKGDTDWLKNGAPHCNVRRDFVDTDRGIKKITDVVGVDDNDAEASQCFKAYFLCISSRKPVAYVSQYYCFFTVRPGTDDI